jgi:GAF domain-containing protein
VEQVLRSLEHETHCSASGLLRANGDQGQLTLYRSRPVDDLFLQAMQQRMLAVYRVSVGPAVVEPHIEVKVLGDAVSGPYEPPRSLLTVPILYEGRVSGIISVASIYPDAFSSADLCTLSFVAAQVSDVLGDTLK